jgi:hypothetical protein
MRFKVVVLATLLLLVIALVLALRSYATSKPSATSNDPKNNADQPQLSSNEEYRVIDRRESAPSEKKETPPQLNSSNPFLLTFVDKNSDDRVPPDFLGKIPRINSDNEIAAVCYLVKDREEVDAIRNEGINLLRRSNYEKIDDLLINLLDDERETERMRAFFTQHLGVGLEILVDGQRDERIRNRLELALSDLQILVKRESLSALVSINNQRALEILNRGLLYPGNENMRDLIIYLYYERDEKKRIEDIRLVLTDADQTTRVAAIYTLGQWGDIASKPAFEIAARSPIHAIKMAGSKALDSLQKLEMPINKDNEGF